MKSHQGFTLIELAIVLVIVTILLGGLAVPLSAQIQARRIAETNKILEEARESIIGYAITNNANPPSSRHLPCPSNGDGKEARTGNACTNISGTISTGFLPWIDLGVASHDAWGNRLRYAVVASLADKSQGFTLASLVPNDPLVICTTYTCPAVTPDVANNLAFVLVSHGPNGWGSQNMNNLPGSLQSAPSGLDEAANLDIDRKYIARAPTQSSAAAGEFDDLLVWTSFNQMKTRVCLTGCP